MLNIWSAWLQGADAAPASTRRIFAMWRKFNPHHDVRIVEQADADKILEELSIPDQRLTPQVTTNIVRTYLLQRHGGVWVDATLLPVCPIDEWLTPELKSQGFFAFRSTGDPNLVLQTWFLYAEAGNPLITQWLEWYSDYFRTRRLFPTWRRALLERKLVSYAYYQYNFRKRNTIWFADPNGGRSCPFYPYAVVNYNFSCMLKQNAALAAHWDRVPRRCAQLPSFLGSLARDPETDPDDFKLFVPELLKVAPVHKLSQSKLSSVATEVAWEMFMESQ